MADDFKFYPRQREWMFHSNREIDLDIETKVEEQTEEQPKQIVLSNKKKKKWASSAK